MTFTKILVPHDFSDHSTRSVEVAAELAGRYKASLTLIYVHQPTLYAAPDTFLLYPTEDSPTLMAAFSKHLDDAKVKAVAGGAGTVETKVLTGMPVNEIAKFAADGGYDLIVMGTHGRSGVAHALIGSVAERVVRKAHCPVLTVRLPSKS
jgi:universal stress protein A